MFVRKNTVGNITYLTLVENIWNPIKKKYNQNKIASLGKLSDLEYQNHRIEKMVTALDLFCKRYGIATISNGIILTDITENEEIVSSSYDFGVHKVASFVLSELGITQTIRVLSHPEISKEKTIASAEGLIAHHLMPKSDVSERSTYAWHKDNLYIPEKIPLGMMDFYRTLDVLIENKDTIEKEYYGRNRDLFNGKLDLVLFDTTSVYYWGAEELANEDDLLRYGFSKDGKGNLKQLIVGVLMTTDGVPIAHEVFPGNTADVNAFSSIVKTLKEKYSIDKVILIADRGMVSEDNLISLEQSGLSYLVGIKMRQLPASLKTKFLVPLDEEEERYELEFIDKLRDNLYTKEFPVSKFSDSEISDLFIEKIKKGKSATFDEEILREQIKKRRFFVCLNPYVAAKKKKDREFFTRIIERKISSTPTKEWVIKNGYKKYLKFDKGLSPSIDYERLRDEETYDGKWILLTNDKHMSSYSAGTYYKSLQFVERGFHDLKSLISMQPVFHYTERRIRAHIFVAFLTLIVKWYIFRKLNQYSQEEGRKFLSEATNLKAVLVDKTSSVYLRTEITPVIRDGFAKLSMKLPGKLLFDGRKKNTVPQRHAGGRPRQFTPGQLHLASDTV